MKTHGKKRKGLTVIEVVTAFMILALLSVGVLATMGRQMLFTQRTKGVTGKSFSGQKEVEKGIQTAEGLIQEKYKLDAEIKSLTNLPNPTPEQTARKTAATTRLNAVITQLNTYPQEKTRLFGKEVLGYKVEAPAVNAQGVQCANLFTWVADREEKSFLLPVIDKVSIFLLGESEKPWFFWATGKKMDSKVTYSKHANLLFHESYEWYLAGPSFHMPYPDSYSSGEILESDIGKKYPGFPGDYEFIPNQQESILDKLEPQYKGRFVLCAVTPAIREMKKGERAISKPVYNHPFPELAMDAAGNSMKYFIVDASLINKVPGTYQEEEVKGILDKGELEKITDKPVPDLHTEGTVTGRIEYGGRIYDTYSRHFEFQPNHAYKVDPESFSNEYSIFVVARLRDVSGPKAILTGETDRGIRLYLGFDGAKLMKGTSGAIIPNASPLDDKWHVFSVGVRRNNLTFQMDEKTKGISSAPPVINETKMKTMQLGEETGLLNSGAKMDVAEIAIVETADETKMEEIVKSLMKKYGLTTNMPAP